MFSFKQFRSSRKWRKNDRNKKSRFKHKKKLNGKGKNSFKTHILKSTDDKINTLDLKNTLYDKCEKVINRRIKETIDKNEFPLRIITHNNTDKIISFKKVMNNYPNLKTMNLDFNNPFTYTIGVL